MSNPIFDYDNGDFAFQLSDNMALDLNGDLMMKMSDNMAMDMNTGELHMTSSWYNEDDDKW